jgi:dienelactone hydrolase
VNRTRWLLLACAVPLAIVLGVLVVAGLGGGGGGGGSRPPAATTAAPAARFVPDSAERIDVGTGAQGAAIFRPRGAGRPGAVVVFLHGWAAVDPAFYGPWIDHLVRRGDTIIYPIYQRAPFLDTASPLPNILIALRRAFEQLSVTPDRLVVAGHSAGAALSVDYAAAARGAGLPEPAAVFSVYPGRSIGDSVQLEPVDASDIAPRTRVLVLAGADDELVGTRWARRIARTATRAETTLRIVRDPAVDDHAGPARSSPEARREFWKPLDRLVDATGRAR